ncbi:hypothetical protein ACFVVX_10740 [Kitasatospora sp. NPDC058170]|uniref:hypothetical protein n=1 Tax=Kitasatospora sp. NPDC058170 TaxID=3346364 RepID=UPI0036D8F3EC
MTTTTSPLPARPAPTVRPDEVATRLTYLERVLAARAAPLIGALDTLRYLIAVEMLARLGEAALTAGPKPYRSFHDKLHSGRYAAAAGGPRPGSLPASASALYLHARLPAVYTATPWWFGAIAQDLLGGEESCADLLAAARQEGLSWTAEGPPVPLRAADLGPEVAPEEIEARLRKAGASTLARTAALLPGVLGLPELRRRWHRDPGQWPDLSGLMDRQAATAERLLAAMEAALPGVDDAALRRQRACHEAMIRVLGPHRAMLPALAQAIDHTPPAEDLAGLPKVLGLLMVAAPVLALPVRIRDELTTHPRGDTAAIEDWKTRAAVEGFSREWTTACLARVLGSAGS